MVAVRRPYSECAESISAAPGQCPRGLRVPTLGPVKGLMLRLSALDADATTALRVIAHFEALLGTSFDAAVLVRSTAGLAECPAGLETADGRTVRFAPDGGELPAVPGAVSESTRLTPAGRVWLERPGEPGPLDELVVEWMAIAAQVLLGRPQSASQQQPPPQPHVADPALAELVLSAREAVEDRARALRLLGLAPDRPLRVLVASIAGPVTVALVRDSGLAAIATVRVTALGEYGVALVQRHEGTASIPSPPPDLRDAVLPPGLRIGIGGGVAALDAGTSWAQARVALRFTSDLAHEAVVAHDDLGTVALLADIPVDRLRAQPDVQALGGLTGESLAALAAFCRTGSLRQAAAELHLHHSSVAGRLAHVEKALGRPLTGPEDRFRAQLALYALRLASG